MADFNRTANSAYYASKQELNIRGTREGSKNPQPVPSYQHVSSDTSASSNKYYAAAPVSAGKPKSKAKQPRHVDLAYGKKGIVEAVLEELAAGATSIAVHGSTEDLQRAQVAVDIAVGRNTLTRTQADCVSYVPAQVEPAAVEIPTAEIESVVEAPVVEETPAIEEPTPEADATEEITEGDVAAAFGVSDDDDSDL
jgi:hypothetical protein